MRNLDNETTQQINNCSSRDEVFLKKTAKYTWRDHKRDDVIHKELQTEPIGKNPQIQKGLDPTCTKNGEGQIATPNFEI
jgi:hypothetical protein